MIPNYLITAWRKQVNWPEDFQVEQDLIISRALINLYEREKIYTSLAFRGGTALNKLYLKPAARYSEDIDLVQITAEPIGETINEIRLALDSWLGEPTRKLTERSVKLLYKYTAIDGTIKRLKIEINTTEHTHFLDFTDHVFSIQNDWFAGQAKIRAYQLNECMGTKLRALYQRRKGRDLFDLWIVLKENLIDCGVVLDVFKKHGDYTQQPITRALFEKNMAEKIHHPDFHQDIIKLLPLNTKWLLDDAVALVQQKLIQALPGEPWKNPAREKK